MLQSQAIISVIRYSIFIHVVPFQLITKSGLAISVSKVTNGNTLITLGQPTYRFPRFSSLF